MTLLDRADRRLLEGFFQPVADRLADRATNFGLARLAAECVMIAVIFRVIHGAFEGGVTTMGVALAAMAIFFAVVISAAMTATESSVRSGCANPLRERFAVPRQLFLLLGLLWAAVLTLKASVPDSFTPTDFYATLEILAWCSVYYFGSCEQRPPMPRRAEVPESPEMVRTGV